MYQAKYLGSDYDSVTEDIFGPVLVRNSEEIDDFISLDSLVEEYVKFNIQKYFNLNVNEYLATTRMYKNSLLKIAIKLMEEEHKANEAIVNEMEQNNAELINLNG